MFFPSQNPNSPRRSKSFKHKNSKFNLLCALCIFTNVFLTLQVFETVPVKTLCKNPMNT